MVLLLLHMPSVSATAARLDAGGPVLPQDRIGDLVQTVVAVLLLSLLVLNVFKPRGMTGFRRGRSDADIGAARRAQ